MGYTSPLRFATDALGLTVAGTTPANRGECSALGHGDVIPGQWVAAQAVGLAGVYGGGVGATQGVDLRRHGFKVPRVEAPVVAAQVVDLESIGDGAVCDFVGVAMCRPAPPSNAVLRVPLVSGHPAGVPADVQFGHSHFGEDVASASIGLVPGNDDDAAGIDALALAAHANDSAVVGNIDPAQAQNGVNGSGVATVGNQDGVAATEWSWPNAAVTLWAATVKQFGERVLAWTTGNVAGPAARTGALHRAAAMGAWGGHASNVVHAAEVR